MKQPTLLLIVGMPGTGKSTLAKKLAHELNLPLIIKDDIKVLLFDIYGWRDREESKKAGQASYNIMDYIAEEQLRVGNSLIIESTYDPKFASPKFQQWQKSYNVRYIQIYCYADADVIRTRFKERALGDNRHVSHIEGEGGMQNLEGFIERGIDPLHIDGPLIKVDTSDFSKIDESAIIAQIRKELDG